MRIRHETIRIEAGDDTPPGIQALAADVFVPQASGSEQGTTVMFCFPGAGMSRRYYDLRTPGSTTHDYSMAHYFASQGHVVITIDHPGVGDSDRPDDGWDLVPRVVADMDGAAVASLKDRLCAGRLIPDLGPLADPRWIGLGHSMGANLTVYQQARRRLFDAVALLGIGARGLWIPPALAQGEWLVAAASGFLSEVVALADRPEELHARLVELGRLQYGDEALPAGTTATSDRLLAGMEVPVEARQAIEASATNLLALCGLSSMVPGSAAPEMAAIDVPVFLGVGAQDITGPPHAIPQAFSGSSDVTLFVLRAAGHNHNVAPNRHELWRRLHRWLVHLDD